MKHMWLEFGAVGGQDVRGVEGRKEEETRRMVRMGGEFNDRSDGMRTTVFWFSFFRERLIRRSPYEPTKFRVNSRKVYFSGQSRHNVYCCSAAITLIQVSILCCSITVARSRM